MAWRCLLRGHLWALVLEHGLIYLSCVRCGTRTKGWSVSLYDPPEGGI